MDGSQHESRLWKSRNEKPLAPPPKSPITEKGLGQLIFRFPGEVEHTCFSSGRDKAPRDTKARESDRQFGAVCDAGTPRAPNVAPV